MLRKNVASQVVTFNLVNATTGAALTGATVTTKVALDGTQSAGAGTVTELGTGQYKYVPTQGETNGTTAGFSFTASNAVPVNLHCFTTAGDPTDAVRQGMTALPNAAAEAAGGLYTRGSGAGQLSQSANGELGVATLAKTITTYTGDTPQTGDAFARLGAPAGASVSADIATKMATYTQPTGFLAATFPTGTIANTTNITAGTITTTTNLTNAATAGDFTATMKTSIGTAVAASAVASVTARVTANTDQLAGQTVTAAAGVTFPSSVASPTNITAGTITTATNLTNAPTVGDFTATMKTSIGTAVAASAVASVTGAVGSVTGLTPATVHADLDDIQARLPAALTANGNMKADTLRVAGTVQTAGDLAVMITAVDDFVDTEIGTISTALNAVLALLDDPRGEPSQGALPVNPDAMTKIDYIYKFLRNKKDNDGTTTKLYADNGTTVDHKQATSVAAGTVEKAEWVTGP